MQSEQDQLFEELKKAGVNADRTDRKRADLFNGLMKHPGWVEYVELLNALINSRGMNVLMPGRSVDGLVALEFEKGAMSGLIMSRDLPSIIVNAVKTSAAPDGEDE